MASSEDNRRGSPHQSPPSDTGVAAGYRDSNTPSHVAPPSDTVAPTQIDTPSQQAATQPGSGVEVHVIQTAAPSFKQQVIGYAKEIRGTILRKPETKEYGDKILKGEATYSKNPSSPAAGEEPQ
ncbi:hypothetical protein A0H81_08635 [Grifola frondosa]|uniref:Uncharacterized protein n=1 Tax=Grifola frondosa TaxID=5627 RepID=A0A1C7M3F8_GRIFR|nr:hypothetical protein A0H81_08635 [Grifola frondosa]